MTKPQLCGLGLEELNDGFAPSRLDIRHIRLSGLKLYDGYGWFVVIDRTILPVGSAESLYHAQRTGLSISRPDLSKRY